MRAETIHDTVADIRPGLAATANQMLRAAE
jgi:hypothetical protein